MRMHFSGLMVPTQLLGKDNYQAYKNTGISEIKSQEIALIRETSGQEAFLLSNSGNYPLEADMALKLAKQNIPFVFLPRPEPQMDQFLFNDQKSLDFAQGFTALYNRVAQVK